MSIIKKIRGFSLIELLIAISIVGVLSALAYPSYLKSVRKANRAEAKSELSDAAQRFQRCYTVAGTFKPTSGCQVYESLKNGGSIITGANLNGFYEIKLLTNPAISDTKFTLEATAIKAPQTKDTKDGCNKLTLDQNGTKGPVACW